MCAFFYLLTRYMRPASAFADNRELLTPYMTKSCPQPLRVIPGHPYLLLPQPARINKGKGKSMTMENEQRKETGGGDKGKYILGQARPALRTLRTWALLLVPIFVHPSIALPDDTLATPHPRIPQKL